MNKIALFGAAGAIGQSIAKAISAQGAPYRVVGRSRDALSAAFGKDSLAEIVTWNPDDPASVQAAARQKLIGPVPKTPYREGVRECLAALRANVQARRT